MSARNHAEALRRLGGLLSAVEDCVLQKLDDTRDAGGNDTYVPTQGKKAAFDAQFTALFNKVKNRENLSAEQFQSEVNGQLKSALEDWVAADGLSCDAAELLSTVIQPFDPPPVINP